MATIIDWSALRQSPNIGAAFQQGFDRSRAQGALNTLARDPSNVDALANLTSVAPEQAYRFQEASRAQANFARGERFRDALSGYMTQGGAPQPDALAPPGNVGGGLIRRLPATATMTPFNTPSGARAPDSHLPEDVPGSLGALAADNGLDGPDIVVRGRRPAPVPRAPVAPGGNGWDEVVRADPTAALAASHQLFGARADELKNWQHVSQVGMRLLGGVRDQESWDRGLATARHLYDSYGVPFPDNLPDEYSPEAVRDLQMSQLDIEDQITAALHERKFEWQREDDEADNARADRNTDSIINDRNARRSLIARGQDKADARGRYGIRVASEDRRRGQNIQRDRPTRASAGAGATGAKLTRIAVGADGKKIGWNGKAWVPAQ